MLITVGWVWWHHQRGPIFSLASGPPTLNPPLVIRDRWKLFYSSIKRTKPVEELGYSYVRRLFWWKHPAGREDAHDEAEISRPLPVFDIGIQFKLKSTVSWMEIRNDLKEVRANESTILSGDFNAHFGTEGMWYTVEGYDPTTWRYYWMITESFCYNNIVQNSFTQHRKLHKYNRCKVSLGQQSIIDVHHVLSWLSRLTFWSSCQKGTQMSTDHHICLRIPSENTIGLTRTGKTTRSYPTK